MPRNEMTENKYLLQNGKFLDFVSDFLLPNCMCILKCEISNSKRATMNNDSSQFLLNLL